MEKKKEGNPRKMVKCMLKLDWKFHFLLIEVLLNWSVDWKDGRIKQRSVQIGLKYISSANHTNFFRINL